MDLPVLVLEKEPQLRSLIRTILSKHGFRILEARDRLTALESVKALDGAMTVIVSSFSMPELNGDAFARIVKADFPDTPVLLMVSGATECDALSGDAFLPKPFLPSELVDTVRRLQENSFTGNDECD